MGFQNIEAIVGTDSTQLSFINEYLEENPEKNGMIVDVLSIIEVKSGKGYLLKTASFVCFCWKKDKAIAYVLERLDDAVEMSTPLRIAVRTDITSKNGFRLLVDEDEGYIWDKNQDTYNIAYDGKVFTKDSPDLPPPLPPAIKPPSKRRRRN